MRLCALVQYGWMHQLVHSSGVHQHQTVAPSVRLVQTLPFGSVAAPRQEGCSWEGGVWEHNLHLTHLYETPALPVATLITTLRCIILCRLDLGDTTRGSIWCFMVCRTGAGIWILAHLASKLPKFSILWLLFGVFLFNHSGSPSRQIDINIS